MNGLESNRRVSTSEVDGNQVTVYGHFHTFDRLKEEEHDIRDLMEEHDQFGMEGLSPVSLEISRGHKLDWEELNDYASLFLDMSLEHTDQVWDPDQYNGAIHNLGASAITLGTYSNIAYEGGRMVKDEFKREEGYSFDLNRLHVLSGALVGAATFFTGILEPVFSFSTSTEDFDEEIYPLMSTYNDMREVYVADGLDTIARQSDEDVFYICGKAHVNSIAGYLEGDEFREAKKEAYGDLLPEWQKELHLWREDDAEWTLEEVYDLD